MYIKLLTPMTAMAFLLRYLLPFGVPKYFCDTKALLKDRNIVWISENCSKFTLLINWGNPLSHFICIGTYCFLHSLLQWMFLLLSVLYKWPPPIKSVHLVEVTPCCAQITAVQHSYRKSNAYAVPCVRVSAAQNTKGSYEPNTNLQGNSYS